MSRPMTREEQAVADKVGEGVTVYIDRNDLDDVSTVMAVVTTKAGVTLPKGCHDYDKAAAYIRTYLALPARDAAA